MASNAKYIRKCQECGKVMYNVVANKIFCAKCLRKHEQLRYYKKLRKEEIKAAQQKEEEEFFKAIRRPHIKPPSKENSISAICARAIAAGRTYGQQVEWEHRQKELKDRGEID